MLTERGFTPLVIILGLVFILGIAGGVYYLGTQKQTQPQMQSNPATTALPTLKRGQSQDLASTSAIDSTANWKAYTNTQYGFSVKYPSGWNTWSYPDSVNSPYSYGSSKEVVEISPDTPPTNVKNSSDVISQHFNSYIRILVSPNPSNLSSLDYIKQTYPSYPGLAPVQVLPKLPSLNILDATEITNLSGAGAPGPELTISTKSNIITIHTEMVNVYKGDMLDTPQNRANAATRTKLYEQIFSTFKFTY